MKTKKSSKNHGDSKKNKKSKLSAKKAAREAKKAARKGDGSFPDIVIVTKEKAKDGSKYFAAHDGKTMETLFNDGEEIAVYKLRRVSTISIKRKVVR